MSSSLLNDMLNRKFKKLSVPEAADIIWNYPSDLFRKYHIGNQSNITLDFKDNYSFILNECLIQSDISQNGSILVNFFPMSITGDRDKEIETLEMLLDAGIYVERVPTEFANVFIADYPVFKAKYSSVIKQERLPNFFYGAKEALDLSGGSKKHLRKIANNALYSNLNIKYITIDTLAQEHLDEVAYLTALWKKHYLSLHTERGEKNPFISNRLSQTYLNCTKLTKPNQWLLILAYDNESGKPVIYSLTERLNPSYVYLALGKHNPNYMEKYPELAKYLFLLETKYWYTLGDMDSDNLIFNGGNGGVIPTSLMSLDEKGKKQDDWDYMNSSNYIYKDSLCFHKKTLRPTLVTPSTNFGKMDWFKKHKEAMKSIPATPKKGIF